MIRKYETRDLTALCELMHDLGYPTNERNMEARLERMNQDSIYNTFVAEIEQNVVGMLGVRKLYTYEIDEAVIQLSALVIKQDYQGRGIGKRFIQFIEQWSKQQGIHTIILTSGIKKEREHAHEFYKKAGFEVTGYRFVKKV